MPPREKRKRRTGPVARRGHTTGPRLGDVLSIVAIVALFGFVYLLPPDSTLADVRESGAIRVCAPESFPPLMTGDEQRPGIDIELVEELAHRIGVRVVVSTNRAIGRDLNPRTWRVSRAQCLLIAGGVVASPTTRGYLETLPPHLETGWAAVRVDPEATLADARVGFFAAVTGLDRIALSRFLREEGAIVSVVQNREGLEQGLRSGDFDLVVTEALTARALAGRLDGEAIWLPESLGRFPIVIGAWKGDLTLTRRLSSEMDALLRDGTLEQILAKYAAVPATSECVVCRDAQ